MGFKYRFVLIFILTCLFNPVTSYSQSKQGKVEIISDPRLNELIEKHKALNESINGIPGYRIQIFSESGTNSKNKSENVKSEFLQKFPYEAAYVLFQEPNYKVRVGDFRTQLDALGFLHKMTPLFPNAFIVSDKIKLPRL